MGLWCKLARRALTRRYKKVSARFYWTQKYAHDIEWSYFLCQETRKGTTPLDFTEHKDFAHDIGWSYFITLAVVSVNWLARSIREDWEERFESLNVLRSILLSK